jgi:hypothetical protein
MDTVSPIFAPIQPEALWALQGWLMDNHYCPHAAGRIVAYAAEEGTPTGSPYLDREDEATATEVYCEALPAVCWTSHEWGNATGDESMFRLEDDTWTPVDALRAIPPELDEEEEAALLAAWDRQADEEIRRLEAGRPAPEPAAYEPTEQDLADYGDWLEMLDRQQFSAMAAPLPPIAGGGPEPAGPTEEELADMREQCERADRLESLRRDLPEPPRYGYE